MGRWHSHGHQIGVPASSSSIRANEASSGLSLRTSSMKRSASDRPVDALSGADA